ncbi:tetratricopeptide repeat protein [Deferrisoma camini]|uniref:tetratricopeptide repeat protein n=1 Tax=Deferrisoma camini TaxID=1035120 RepID=UPI00046CFE02|nr:tetratricopeptide repeat protein [Deferrisoma camini]
MIAGRLWPGRGGFALVLAVSAVLGAAVPSRAVVLARVEPGWSPFLRAGPPPGREALWAEAGRTLAEDPARVARVVGKAAAAAGAPAQLRGLWADALYLAGRDTLWQAERVYRTLVKEELDAEQTAWCWFQLGNVQRIQGFPEAAAVSYEQAVPGSREPWQRALRFDRAALALEAGRIPEAVAAWRAWVRAYPRAPGRVVGLYLWGESLWRAGAEAEAVERFRQARRLDPDGWRVRTETARAMAEAFEAAGDVDAAADVLEAVARLHPGTADGAEALLAVGALWTKEGRVERAAAAYARLLDGPAPAEAAREARLRLALLGVRFAERVELTEPYPAYRWFYRPRPVLEDLAGGRDPLAAQRALEGLAELARSDGDAQAALGFLERVFRDYPESPESGRAYEAFVSLLEARVAELVRDGDPAAGLLLFERFRGSAGWVATRDLGALVWEAARAAEALGAWDRALELYGEVKAMGSRAVPARRAEAAALRLRAREGDPDAVARWAAERPRDWRAQLALARVRADEGDRSGALEAFRRALARAPDDAARYAVRIEMDRVGRGEARTQDLFRAWKARRELWQKLAAEGGRDLPAPSPVAGGRLAFALGRYGEALSLLPAKGGEPVDRLFRSVSALRTGDGSGARAAWVDLAETEDPVASGAARALAGAEALLTREGKP